MEGPQQTGDKHCQGPHAIHHGEVQSPAPGKEHPQAPAHAGGQWLEKSFAGQGLGHLVDHQPAVCPCGTPGVLCPVLHSPILEGCRESPEVGAGNKVIKGLQHFLDEEMLEKL